MRKVFISLLIIGSLGCALPPSDTSGQKFVPEDDLSAVRYVKEGLNYMSGGRYLDAEIKFQKALILEPQSEPILQNIGVSLYMQERFDEALNLFQELLRRDPISLPLRAWIGKTEAARGNPDGAAAILKEAYQLALERWALPTGTFVDQANASAAAQSLSSLYFDQGDQTNALCFANSSYGLFTTPQSVDRYARILLSSGYTKNAKDMIASFLGASGAAQIREIGVRKAIIQFSEGSMDDALFSIKEAFLLPSTDPELLLECKAAMLVIVDRLKSQGKDINTGALDDEASEIFLDPRLDGVMSLYWPKEFTEALYDMRKKFQ